MEPRHKAWNEQQQRLNRAVLRITDHQEAVEIFLRQHAMVQARAVSGMGETTFEDEVWENLCGNAARCIPRGFEHSIVWMLWHTARIEDVTMNMLVGQGEQLFDVDGWRDRLGASAVDTGNLMNSEEVLRLSAEMDVTELRAYRLAVGQCTREIVKQCEPGRLQEMVAGSDLARVAAVGAVVPRAADLLEYWGGKTIGGLLLMPPTRHALLHLNEAMRVKAKIYKS